MAQDENPQPSKPTGKRQRAGAQPVTSSSYQAKAEPARAANKSDEKPGGGVTSFLPEVVEEVRKVIWPTARQMVVYTLVVFAFLIVMTALVWSVDFVTGLGVEAVLGN